METECDRCNDKLMHWHCRHCGHFLSQLVEWCPKCGIRKPVMLKGSRR